MRFWAVVLLLLLVSFGTGAVQAVEDAHQMKTTSAVPDAQSAYVPGQVLVKLQNGDVQSFAARHGVAVGEEHLHGGLQVFATRSGESVEQLVRRIQDDPDVAYAQPNFVYETFAINSNDTYRNSLWGLHNSGQTVNGVAGTADADIDAPEAWAIDQGSDDVIIAVIDTGVAYNHPDLAANMWNGSRCKNASGTRINNCLHGYDFEDDDLNPLPTSNSHGTHVAGTIAAVKNNSTGIIGVAPRATIMAVKTGLTSVDNVRSVNFARYNGATVINASWGGAASTCSGIFDRALYDAMAAFPGIILAAAGNASADHDGATYFDIPADYGHTTDCWDALPNVLSIAATDADDGLASFSDYGEFVDVAAPGVNIYSTWGEDTALDQDFESVVAPAVPSGWTRGGTGNNWGTYDFGTTTTLYGDLAYPYTNSANTTLTTTAIPLNGTTAPHMSFVAACDTEIDFVYWSDYLVLEFSADGSSFTEVLRFDEISNTLDFNTSPYAFDFAIPAEYQTANFTVRFRWVADASDNIYDGCQVDNLIVTSFTDGSGETYAFSDGTSMATPHVAGLTALIWGANPSLTRYQVREILRESGDVLPALRGAVNTTRRINAQRALLQAAQQAPTLGIVVSSASNREPLVKRVTTSGNKIVQFRASTTVGGVSSVEADVTGDGVNEIVVAPGPGLGAKVKAYTKSGKVVAAFAPFGSAFDAGVSVAAGDVNGDGREEVIVAPLTAGEANVKVFRYSGGKFTRLATVAAFGRSVRRPHNHSCGDVNGDCWPEVVVSPYQDANRDDRLVKVYTYRGGKLVRLATKRPYANTTYQGLQTQVADLDGDGSAEIAVVPSRNAGDDLVVYRYASGALVKVDSLRAYSQSFNGRTALAAGDVNGDGTDELALTVLSGEKVDVSLYVLDDGQLVRRDRYRAYDAAFTGGVTALLRDVDGDEEAEVVTGPARGVQKVKVWDASSTTQRVQSSFWAFGSTFAGGVSFTE